MIETGEDGAGSAVSHYWLLLLHLKKNDLAASQVDYQHTVLFMNSFGTLSPLYNKLAKLIVCCPLHLLRFFSFLFFFFFDLLGSFVQSKVRWKQQAGFVLLCVCRKWQSIPSDEKASNREMHPCLSVRTILSGFIKQDMLMSVIVKK